MEEAAIAYGDTGSTSFGTEGRPFYPMMNCSSFIRKEEIKAKVEVGKEKTQIKGTGIDIAYFKFPHANTRLFLDDIYVADDIDVNVTSTYSAVLNIISIIYNKDYRKPTLVIPTESKAPAVEQAEAIPDTVPEEDVDDFTANTPKESIMDYLAEHP